MLKKRVKLIRQMEYSECGLASLLMILNYYGYEVPLTVFREKYPCPRGGFSLYELYRIAQLEQLEPEAFRVDLEDIPKEYLPCILHYERGHFVVLEAYKKNKYTIIDPSSGKRRISFSELKSEYSGAMLSLKVKSSFNPIKRKENNLVNKYFSEAKIKLVKVALLSLLFQLVLLAVPILAQNITDAINGTGFPDFKLYWIGGTIFFASYFTVKSLRGLLITNVELILDKSIMKDFMDKLIKLPYSFFSNRSNSDILMRANSGTIIRDVLTNKVVTMFIDLIILVTYSLLLYHYSPRLTLFLVVICLIVIAIIAINTKILKKRVDKNLSERVDVQKILAEIVYNIIDIKTLGGEKVFIDKWLKSYDVELRSSKHINIIQIIADAITSAIRTVIPISVLLLGAKMVQQDIISIGVLFAFNSVSGAFVDPIISIGQNVSTIVALDVYFKRIKDVINSTPEQVELENNERFVLNSIELRNISYKYNMFGNNIIEDIDMYIERGQSVAFVGLSGSGKSTILKLLLGIYKVSSGKILYNGIDINDMDVRSLRSSAGVVLQESKLFTGTIRDNIVMNRDVTEEELISACKKALIFDDIMNTPLKFDTIVSEQGINFSGGQRQRILIARALVNNPSMIIFDEATSNLDNLIEKAIYENLNELDCIKIIVAHRLSTIKNVDKIVCIHNSRVVEVGNHDELMSRKGFYYYLYENEEKNK